MLHVVFVLTTFFSAFVGASWASEPVLRCDWAINLVGQNDSLGASSPGGQRPIIVPMDTKTPVQRTLSFTGRDFSLKDYSAALVMHVTANQSDVEFTVKHVFHNSKPISFKANETDRNGPFTHRLNLLRPEVTSASDAPFTITQFILELWDGLLFNVALTCSKSDLRTETLNMLNGQ